MSMARERQRAIGALRLRVDAARESQRSTLPVTIHCSADTLDYLATEGAELFRDYDAKTRRRMASEGRALPDGSFPIATCQDAQDAIRSQGRAGNNSPETVRRHITKRVRALRCSGSIFEPYK